LAVDVIINEGLDPFRYFATRDLSVYQGLTETGFGIACYAHALLAYPVEVWEISPEDALHLWGFWFRKGGLQEQSAGGFVLLDKLP
jgi:hypothetical protein